MKRSTYNRVTKVIREDRDPNDTLEYKLALLKMIEDIFNQNPVEDMGENKS